MASCISFSFLTHNKAPTKNLLWADRVMDPAFWNVILQSYCFLKIHKFIVFLNLQWVNWSTRGKKEIKRHFNTCQYHCLLFFVCFFFWNIKCRKASVLFIFTFCSIWDTSTYKDKWLIWNSQYWKRGLSLCDLFTLGSWEAEQHD